MRIAEQVFLAVILLGLVFYSHFYKLDALPYRIWDEARLANNAYAMSQSGNLIVTKIGDNPDMLCTKPPLMIWAQAACIKVNGINELSVRFPAALFALLTIGLVFVVLFRLTADVWAASISVIVLCTAVGYISYHTTRAGEYDSALTFFTTTSILSLFLYCEGTGRQKNNYLLLFFIALTLGVLTKGIVILMFGPLLFIYLLANKQLVATLKNKRFYIGLAIFFVFGVGYYFLREQLNPGYLLAVYNNELGGRFAEVNEGHVGSFSYYYNYIRYEQFGNWYWALPLGLLVLAFIDQPKLRRLMLLCYLCSIGFLLLLSSSATKLAWYDMPLFPLFAIIISIVILQLSKYISKILPSINQKIAVILLVVIFSIQPIYQMPPYINLHERDFEEGYYSTSYYLRNKVETHSNGLKDATFVDTGYMSLAYIPYVAALNEQGQNIKSVLYWNDFSFEKGEKVITSNNTVREKIIMTYTYKVIDKLGDLQIIQIIEAKSFN